MASLTFLDHGRAKAVYEVKTSPLLVVGENSDYALRVASRFESAPTFEEFCKTNRIAIVQGVA